MFAQAAEAKGRFEEHGCGMFSQGFLSYSLSWISRREWDIFSLQPLVSAKTFIDSLFNCLCLLAVKFFCSYIPFSM